MTERGQKTMKKKVISIALVLALALSIAALSGCGSSKERGYNNRKESVYQSNKVVGL